MNLYLDYNATAPMKRAVREAMIRAMSSCGNPSSVHAAGRAARATVEGAREQIADLVAVNPAQVVFTSGGTEANNMAVRGWAGPVLASAVAHDSVLACAPATTIPVDRDGLVDVFALERLLGSLTQPALISLILVNNETGVVQPLDAIVPVARKYLARIHGDAVQLPGKMPLNFKALGVDMLSLSAHKLGGPQGVGALVVAENMALESLLRGGGQEKRRRAGTENVAGIAGFGQAAALAHEDLAHQQQLGLWRDALECAIRNVAPDAIFAGENAQRVANTSCIIMPGVRSATQLMAFDLAGIAVSSGAACSSGKVAPSHVLQAMGFDAESSLSAVRISLGWDTQPSDVNAVAQNWQILYERTGRRAA